MEITEADFPFNHLSDLSIEHNNWDMGSFPYPGGDSHTNGADGEARRTTDQNRCLEFHYNSQVIFHSDVPNLPLYCPIDPYFVSEQLLGLELGTRLYSSSRFSNIHEWSLEKDLDSRGP